MDRDNQKRLEGEEIQEGLEKFLEQELQMEQLKKSPDISLAHPRQPVKEIQTIQTTRVAQTTPTAHTTQQTAQTKRKTEPDISLARPRENVQSAGSEQKKTERNAKSRTNVRSERGTEQRKKEDATRSDRVKMSKPQKSSKKKNKISGKQLDNGKQNPKPKKQQKKKKNSVKKFLLVVAALFVFGFAGMYLLVSGVYSKMNYKEIESVSKESMKEDGVINVLLIGNDSRSEGEDGRSDAMILVSISDKTKTITMTSLLRDMYVEIPGHDGNRLNAAYSYGGPELLMETIEYNFDIPVHRYALVNFQAFANLVDAVGGVDLELTNDEVQYVNGYLMEYNQLEGRELATDFLDPSLSGMLHLNGPQALAYTRNRYIGTDFGRTERQRKVLSEVFGKLPGAVLTNGGEVIDGLFPNLTTNLEQGECFNISLNAWKIVGYDMVQQAVPIEGSYSNASIRGMAVLEVDFEANKAFLQETLYGK